MPWKPSKRQARAEGLKRRYYPTYLRDLVDYDYEGDLDEDELAWLAAFTEEHYRGWRLKGEEQVTPRDATSRAQNATAQRLLRRAKSGALETPEVRDASEEEQDGRNVQEAMVEGIFRKRGGR